MNDTVIAKSRSRVEVQSKSKTNVYAEVDRVIIGSIAAFTGVIGIWSAACLVSALFQAGGPLQLASGYFKALAGI